jgi:hypothetical protein
MVFDRFFRFAILASVSAVGILTASQASASIFYFSALLDGAQETPPNASAAKGLGIFSLDDSTGDFSYQILFTAPLLSGPETAAHIHGPAGPGVPAGVIFPLPLGSPISGTISGVTAAQQADLKAGLWYVNVHTTTLPGGEIRGQIIPGLPIGIIVPEPASLALAVVGALGLGLCVLRKVR